MICPIDPFSVFPMFPVFPVKLAMLYTRDIYTREKKVYVSSRV